MEMGRFRNTVIVLFALFISVNVQAIGPSKTVYSRGTPSNWTNNSHWSSTSGGGSCACTPDESKDVIYIETASSAATSINFGSSVTLVVRNNATLTINGDVTFANGAVIDVQAGSRLVISGNLINNNNSNQVTINGSLSVGGNFDGGNGSTITGAGSMDVTGTATTSGTGAVFGSNGSCSGCTISPSTPLPVEFLMLEAESKNGAVEVKWSTALEWNSDHFVIQRSGGGSLFSNVGQVLAAGTSNTVKEYSFIDHDPLNGNSYYRLMQVDLNGKYTYSEVVGVNNSEASELVLLPNPMIEKGYARFSLSKDLPVSIGIFDMAGREIEVISQGILASGFHTISIPVHDLETGVYFCKMTAGNTVLNEKIVVIR